MKRGGTPFSIAQEPRARLRLALASVSLVLAVSSPWRYPQSSDGLLVLRTAIALAFESEMRLPPEPRPGAFAMLYFVRAPRGDGVVAKYAPFAALARAPLIRAAAALPEGRVSGVALDVALSALPLAAAVLSIPFLARLVRCGGAGRGAAAPIAAALVLTTFVGPLAVTDFQEPFLFLFCAASLERAIVSRRLRGRSRRLALLAAGAAAGLALLTKPTALVLAGPIALAALFPRRRDRARVRALGWPALGLAPFVALLVLLNVWRFGSPLETGYQGEALGQVGTGRLWTLLRLTVLPNRGLFVWAPLLLLAFDSARRGVRGRPRRVDLVASAVAAGGFFAANLWWWAWEGGFGWGPRLLAPAVACAAPLVAGSGRVWRWAAVLLACAGAVVNVSTYAISSGAIYEQASRAAPGAPLLGPAVPVHLRKDGSLHPLQRPHYVPSEASWIQAPKLLAAALSGRAAREDDSVGVRLLTGRPVFGSATSIGSVLLDEGVVSEPVEPERALRMVRRSLALGGPEADACALGSFLSLKRGDPSSALLFAERGLRAAPTRPDLLLNRELASRSLELGTPTLSR